MERCRDLGGLWGVPKLLWVVERSEDCMSGGWCGEDWVGKGRYLSMGDFCRLGRVVGDAKAWIDGGGVITEDTPI